MGIKRTQRDFDCPEYDPFQSSLFDYEHDETEDTEEPSDD